MTLFGAQKAWGLAIAGAWQQDDRGDLVGFQNFGRSYSTADK
jgi:hypothetical protein